jgi:hypothetical protein
VMPGAKMPPVPMVRRPRAPHKLKATRLGARDVG